MLCLIVSIGCYVFTVTVTDTVVKTCPTALSPLVCVTHYVSWYNSATTARNKDKEWVDADVGRGGAVSFSKSVVTESEHMERKSSYDSPKFRCLSEIRLHTSSCSWTIYKDGMENRQTVDNC